MAKYKISILLSLVFSTSIFAQALKPSPAFSRPVILLIALGALALLPFILMMVTSFVKIVVVFSIVRSALGTQQIPPNQVVTGLAVILTIHIMTPVGIEIYHQASSAFLARTNKPIFSEESFNIFANAVKKGKEPMLEFLYKHSHPKERNLFVSLGRKLAKTKEEASKINDRSFIVLIPAFVISELKEAFQIGFIIFVPFLIIDMVVANVLMAMGMFMLSPTMVSLPFKILLFVLVDGWYIISKGLVLGYIR